MTELSIGLAVPCQAPPGWGDEGNRPTKVGSVGGLVGVIGGLGGFVMPILFGAMTQATHLPTTTFAFLFVLSVTCLVWMHVVIQRMSREAAPKIAEELESGLQAQ